MEVKWIKLMTDMFDNRKIRYLRRLPDGNSIVLIWVMLLSMAGRCNASGMIFLTENIPYTPKMLADELDFEESTVSLAITALENLGMISSDPLEITNWEEYQNVEGMEKVKEQTRKRVANYRDRKKALKEGEPSCNVTRNATVTQCNATDIEEELEEEVEEEVETIETSDDVSCRSDERQKVIDEWNGLGISPVSRMTSGMKRYSMLNARLKEYGLDAVIQAIWNVRLSSFLRGQNKDGWTITFDWFVRPNNFVKVLEGNYTDKEGQQRQNARPEKESSASAFARMLREGAFNE